VPGAGPRLGVVAAPAHLEDGLLARPVHALDLGDLRRDVLEELAVGLSPDVQPGIFALFEVGSDSFLPSASPQPLSPNSPYPPT
jgi:hypothetical protein